jgi:hypothetical protein
MNSKMQKIWAVILVCAVLVAVASNYIFPGALSLLSLESYVINVVNGVYGSSDVFYSDAVLIALGILPLVFIVASVFCFYKEKFKKWIFVVMLLILLAICSIILTFNIKVYDQTVSVSEGPFISKDYKISELKVFVYERESACKKGKNAPRIPCKLVIFNILEDNKILLTRTVRDFYDDASNSIVQAIDNNFKKLINKGAKANLH